MYISSIISDDNVDMPGKMLFIQTFEKHVHSPSLPSLRGFPSDLPVLSPESFAVQTRSSPHNEGLFRVTAQRRSGGLNQLPSFCSRVTDRRRPRRGVRSVRSTFPPPGPLAPARLLSRLRRHTPSSRSLSDFVSCV